jgi:phosphatidylinositol kinase/protein kinase (PI-3  family)
LTCLNEECGLLEWVDDTNCLRHHLLTESYSYFSPKEYPPV